MLSASGVCVRRPLDALLDPSGGRGGQPAALWQAWYRAVCLKRFPTHTHTHNKTTCLGLGDARRGPGPAAFALHERCWHFLLTVVMQRAQGQTQRRAATARRRRRPVPAAVQQSAAARLPVRAGRCGCVRLSSIGASACGCRSRGTMCLGASAGAGTASGWSTAARGKSCSGAWECMAAASCKALLESVGAASADAQCRG